MSKQTNLINIGAADYFHIEIQIISGNDGNVKRFIPREDPTYEEANLRRIFLVYNGDHFQVNFSSYITYTGCVVLK